MISGTIIISNPKWYPFSAVLESMIPVCNEILINVDSSNDYSLPEVEEILSSLDSKKVRIISSLWNWDAKDKGQELARQTNFVISQAKEDWILDLQADEALHENEYPKLFNFIEKCDSNISGYEIPRLYFYGNPKILRLDWTVPLKRLFKKGSHIVDGDAMNTHTLWGQVAHVRGLNLYHYSRIGDERIMVDRIMKLSSLYHEKETLHPPEKYEFKTYEYDSFSTDNPPEEVDPDEVLIPFEGTHPASIVKWYSEKGLWPE